MFLLAAVFAVYIECTTLRENVFKVFVKFGVCSGIRCSGSKDYSLTTWFQLVT